MMNERSFNDWLASLPTLIHEQNPQLESALASLDAAQTLRMNLMLWSCRNARTVQRTRPSTTVGRVGCSDINAMAVDGR